ncbi:hypothetical protein JHK84_027237 [Glycine max]|nr:hypothetical protein JHK84_027237 [Glycine max]
MQNHSPSLPNLRSNGGHRAPPRPIPHDITHLLLRHSHLPFTQIPNPDLFLFNLFIRAFSLSHSPHHALSLSLQKNAIFFPTHHHPSPLTPSPSPSSSSPAPSFCFQNSAIRVITEMTQVFVEPDGYTFVAFLSACSSFEDRLIGKVVHVLVYRKLDCLGGNVLLVNVEVARRLFDQMGGRDVVSWTAMISGYCHAGCFQEALELFVQLEELRMEPDEVVAVAPLSACAWLGALELGRRIHHKYDGESWQCGYHRGFACAVVDMYAKCGSIDTALDVFVNTSDDMKTTFLYNSIVSGLAHHGRGLKPDEVTFVALLCACGHSGLVDEGKRLFESMLSEYGVNHQMEHYGCMIDLLSRAGHLNEAYRLIQNMLLKANAVIWRALLSACKLLAVEHDHGVRYVMLSNMPALMEKNDEAASVRKAIDNVVIQKPLAGATWK